MHLKVTHQALVFAIILVISLMMPLSFIQAKGGPKKQPAPQQDWFQVSFKGMTNNADGTSTWTYHVKELEGVKGSKDLSHWVLGLGSCAKVTEAVPSPYEVNKDPRTELYGIKWEVTDRFTDGYFSFTLEGQWSQDDDDEVQFATKAGNVIEHGLVTGPICPDEPMPEPVDEPADEPTPEPVDEPTDEPTPEPVDEPAGEPTPEPVDEPAGEPTPEPVDEPAGEPTPEPVDEPAGEPTPEPTPEPTDAPMPGV